MTNNLKKELHHLCVDLIQQRIDAARQAIEAAQQAAKDDTKSSAGDKYETGREMMQQETNRNMAQLTEANKLLVTLNQVSINGHSAQAEAGSVVVTDSGRFYISVSVGTFIHEGQTYFAISPGSPIGQKMKGCKVGDEFSLNGKGYKVLEVI
ncbi:3-oxoacyl-ACP synthase [Mucilaginibacter sp. Bleaf8]|uniref:3-oxoacyl-ACP synthase n=1 Tax=Mucilaginibacter sp. Bleaf8 TaxID=2834430 RepID=UPI001BD00995|nr:3-oxoacyl-ACP synthase [Mucilaginibacter sp. Bleaf8]MBS7563648.1 3-oxoacyl-ACP synthase [Mucilaginibacter sp. Bleaf8]